MSGPATGTVRGPAGSATITGVVLAGGLGRRMGGVDKGLQVFRGRPMVASVLERLRPQVDAILINANQNRERYEEFGYPVVADVVSGFAGPLAGLHAALRHATTPLVMTVPCDSPMLPADLAARLQAGLEQTGADLAVARTFDQTHPVFALLRSGVRDHLEQFLQGGGRKIDAWYADLATVEVGFDDEAQAFANINTLGELAELEVRPAGTKDGAR
jgi:molybdopterin-guanine dinucleotide biosynthesis protein A